MRFVLQKGKAANIVRTPADFSGLVSERPIQRGTVLHCILNMHQPIEFVLSCPGRTSVIGTGGQVRRKPQSPPKCGGTQILPLEPR